VTSGIDNLIIKSCDALDQTGSVVDFVTDSLPTLVQSLGEVIGVDSTCGAQLASLSVDPDSLTTTWMCTHLNSGCRSQLVSGVSSVPLLGEYVPNGTEALLNAACDIFDDRTDEKTDFEAVIANHMGTIVDIVAKVVNLSPPCSANLHIVAVDMKRNYANGDSSIGNGKLFCQVDETCAKELVSGFRSISLIRDAVPEGMDYLLESACPLLEVDSTEGERAYMAAIIGPGGLLDRFPKLLRIVGDLSRSYNEVGYAVTDHCHRKFQLAEANEYAGTPNSWGNIMPCIVGRECMDEALVATAHLPLIGTTFTDATSKYTGLIDLMTSTPCKTPKPTAKPTTFEEAPTPRPTFERERDAPLPVLGIGLGAAAAVATACAVAMYTKRRRAQANFTRRGGFASAYSSAPKRRDSTTEIKFRRQDPPAGPSIMIENPMASRV
jgi:hypothetical protein